jgi:hypothetical protein
MYGRKFFLTDEFQKMKKKYEKLFEADPTGPNLDRVFNSRRGRVCA